MSECGRKSTLKLLGLCNKRALGNLFVDYGYAANLAITPEVMRDALQSNDALFKERFVAIVKQARGMALSRVDGDPEQPTSYDWFSSSLTFLGAGLEASKWWGIDIDGANAANANATAEGYKAQQALANATAANKVPWTTIAIAGVVVVAIIAVVVLKKKK